jgi:class 3 adenylate cyclase
MFSVHSSSTQTVSVLITDLVGSTAIADRLGPARAEQLRSEHFELLREVLERTGGREVKNLGDGLMVAFDSASRALECAVEMQQTIDARNRRAEEQVGVRIGVSLGDATEEEGDYFGLPSVEAARLCAEAEGGQIVVNELVRLVSGARDGDNFRSLGALELKGISERVPAFELQWEPLRPFEISLPERLGELPTTGYVGRVAEQERLGELWGEARNGPLRLALLSGEAGIGKTRLCSHLALQVGAEGATVLYGHCDEDLGVPYQPWGQALGYLVKEAPKKVLDTHVERHGGALARLVPALRERASELPPVHETDPETERYLLYAAAADLLERSSEREPLLLVLDDLHWADQPTLSLLHQVLMVASSMRAMVVGTYRDSDLSPDHPLAALLADLHRGQGGERIKLTGLESGDVLALIEVAAGQELEEDGRELASEIARETAGNPFFAGELLRHLTESGALAQQEDGRWRVVGDLSELGLPRSVREVLGRRVERLGPDARTALSAAAVIGREFDLDLLLAAVDLSEGQLLDLLDEAVAASLLRESSERAGRFNFTHALAEHTLYEDLGATRRARLHRRVAEALEQQCGDEPGERLGELAGHWAAAVVTGDDAATAMHYAERAAERALDQLAPDEAARWYRRALEFYDRVPAGNSTERCDLLIGLGQAQRQSGDPDHRQTLLEAATIAQEVEDRDRLCRAVLANSRGWSSQVGAVDSERVEALEAAAEALPEDDPRRAQVLALLATELHYAGDPARCKSLAAEALAIARAAGDPHALVGTLFNICSAIWTPDTVEERRRLTEEMAALVAGLEDPWLSFITAGSQWIQGSESGDRDEAETGLETMRALAATVRQPSFVWLLLLDECIWALMQGDLQSAEELATDAFESATASGEPDAALFLGAQLFIIRYHQGRAGELADQLLEMARLQESIPAWRAAAAMALLQDSRSDEARQLALADDFESAPMDAAWAGAAVGWAEVCSDLALRDRSEELYKLMAPFAGQVASGGSVLYGSFDWALGSLAANLERPEEAEEHFAAAAQLDQGFCGPLFLARTNASWASMLIARGRPDDLDRAVPMLDQAEQAARGAGAAAIIEKVAEGRSAAQL